MKMKIAAIMTLMGMVSMAAMAGFGGCGGGAVCTESSNGLPVYRDSSVPVEGRVMDLLSRMTIEEKVGQMTQLDCRWIDSDTSQIAIYNLGSLLSGGGPALMDGRGSSPIPNIPREWANMYNKYQKVAVEETQLGIPLIYGIDAVHGCGNVWGAVIFPHNIGMGATWDPGTVERSAAVTATEVSATGIDWTFSPVCDVVRNEKWGRTYESFGEDPYLCGIMAAAAVKGYQGENLSSMDTILACAKHYVGSGGTENGIDQGNALLGDRELWEGHLSVFDAAVDAGAGSVMISYCKVNGAPSHFSRKLIDGTLRNKMGFESFTVSDWAAIDNMASYMKIDYKTGVGLAVNAGLDMVMVPDDAEKFQSSLLALVREGAVSVKRIDEAVGRILKTKFELGLFENPYADPDETNKIGSQPHRDVALQAAMESLVLLKNEGVLPLHKDTKTILVAGPSANSMANQCGGWTIGWQGCGTGQAQALPPPGTTILEGIMARAMPQTAVLFVESNTELARTAAKVSDVAIVVVGETPYAEYCGDAEDLNLSQGQQELIRAIAETGTPTVVVLVAGRPMIVEHLLKDVDGLLMAWLPGSEGQCVAEVLFGGYNPGGKLPLSWPRTMKQLPLNYDESRDENWADYDPLFQFGYGLSYTRFEYIGMALDRTKIQTNGSINITVEVKNVGERAGDEVAQIYIGCNGSKVDRPVMKLKRFKRITLEAGETKSASFEILAKDLAYYDMKTSSWEIEPIEYIAYAGSSFTDARLNKTFGVVTEQVKDAGGSKGFIPGFEIWLAISVIAIFAIIKRKWSVDK